MNLTALETVAVHKAISEAAFKAVRPEVDPGQYQIDTIVRVKGSVKVGADYDQRIVGKAQPWNLLVAALDLLNGVSIDALVRRAESLDESLVADIKAKADEAAGKLKAATVTHCKGKVTVGLTVEAVEFAPAPRITGRVTAGVEGVAVTR